MDRARISTTIKSLVASATLLALASGCAMVDGQGNLTRNGRFWTKAGLLTDRTGSTDPYNNPDARLAESGD